MVGPDLLQNRIVALLRFRQHKYAVFADRETMLLQVGVLDQDQPREDHTSDVVFHQCTRHVFGARDSSTCANYASQKIANDNDSTYPEAASVGAEIFYLDDYLDSFRHIEYSIKISRHLVKLLKLGGFVLTNVGELTFAMNPEVNETPSSVK